MSWGVASHWRYKEGGKQDQSLDRKIIWLRQLLEWKDEMTDAAEFVESVKSDAFGDQIYLFTPQGRVIDLPQGATPIDFAYAIHTEVGHRCRGAKVNGRIVPLTYRLKTGEQVEILTVKNGGPSRDWLSPHAGYVQTSRARSRIQRWFKQENVEESIAQGKRILVKELHRLGLSELSLEKLAKRLNFDKVDDMFRMLAEGELKPMRVVNAAQEITGLAELEREPCIPVRQIEPSRAKGDFKIQGVGNLMTNIAACCRPVPGEPIVGYITQGRGVSIHRRDCGNILKQQTLAPERLVEVEWGGESDDAYPVDISVLAYDRSGLLRDITSVLGDEKINVLAMSTQVDKKEHMARIQLTVEVSDLVKISQVLSRIQQVPNVTEARRRFH